MKSLLLLLIIFSGCLGPVKELYPGDKSQRPVPVYVISHGWHTGIAIEKAEIENWLPDHEQIPDGQIIMFEWGDGRYFPHPDPGFGLLVRAALWPTRSVLQVSAFDHPIAEKFLNSDVIQIQITKEGAEEMAVFISDQFRYDTNGNIIFATEGLYINSSFFEADRLYFLPRTSNKWVARALRKTGYPITPFWAYTSGNVIKQSKKDGERIR